MTDRVRVGSIQVVFGAGRAVEAAEALSFQQPGDECRISDVGLFDELPADLSFGDGREQLFFEQARERAPGKPAV